SAAPWFTSMIAFRYLGDGNATMRFDGVTVVSVAASLASRNQEYGLWAAIRAQRSPNAPSSTRCASIDWARAARKAFSKRAKLTYASPAPWRASPSVTPGPVSPQRAPASEDGGVHGLGT